MHVGQRTVKISDARLTACETYEGVEVLQYREERKTYWDHLLLVFGLYVLLRSVAD